MVSYPISEKELVGTCEPAALAARCCDPVADAAGSPAVDSIRSAAGRADALADVAEGVVGVGAQGRDGGDAHHDDEGQHDGVLDRGRAVFVLEEVDEVLTELTHGVLSHFRKRTRWYLRTGRAGCQVL